MNPAKIEIQTPLGKIAARLSRDPGYPAIHVEWGGQTVAVLSGGNIEDDEVERRMVLLVWIYNHYGDPDYVIVIEKREGELQ